MSSHFARLRGALDRVGTTTPGTIVGVFAEDLTAIMNHYVEVVREAAELKARAQPAQAVPLLSDDEIDEHIKTHNEGFIGGMHMVHLCRAIEHAVRSKLGAGVASSNGGGAVVPALLSTDEWFAFWDTNDNVDGESVFPEFLYLAQDIEQLVLAKVGIVGKEGGK